MKWKRWLIKCAYLSCITILASSYTTKTIGTMYIEELNKEYHISLPTNSFHVSGVSDDVDKPKFGSTPITNNSHKTTSNPTFLNLTNNQKNSNNEFLTPEKLVEIKQHMSSDDKLKIYSLITSKIPQGEIQKISSLVENGLTKEKLIEIQKILNQNLNEQEYSELISIFSKY